MTPSDTPGDDAGDIALSVADRDLLLSTIADIFYTEASAVLLLRQIRFPRALIPNFSSSLDFWITVFQELDAGAISAGYRRLLTAALRPYAHNETLSALAEQYLTPSSQSHSGPASSRSHPLDMSIRDRRRLLDGLARVFDNPTDANVLLERIGYPRALRPEFDTPSRFWTEIIGRAEDGAIADGTYQILDMAVKTYPGNRDFSALASKYLVDSNEPEANLAVIAGGTTIAPHGTCHVVVRASSVADGERARAILSELGLEPVVEWSTANAISFQVNSSDQEIVKSLLRGTDLGWTVIPPGAQAYVLRFLSVEGPDGRSFRFSDVPGQVKVQDIAHELAQFYDMPPKRTVIVYVASHGRYQPSTSLRLNPDATLDESAVGDGDRLRVGFEVRASGSTATAPHETSSESRESQQPSDSTYLEHAVDEIFEEAGIQLDSGGPDVALTEKRFLHPPLRIVQLTAGEASAVLELHDDYWTYYWRSTLGPVDFARRILQRNDTTTASLTVIDETGNVSRIPVDDAGEPLLGRLGEGPGSTHWTLLRFDGPERSWAWQRLPEEIADHRSGRNAAAYVGCASTANHNENFRLATDFLIDSAVDASSLVQHIHLLEHYITRWDQENWKVQPQNHR